MPSSPRFPWAVIANLLKAFYWTQNMYIIVFLYPCMLSVFAMRMLFGPRQPQPAPIKGWSPELPLHCRLQPFFHARQLSLAGSRQVACYYLRETKQRHYQPQRNFYEQLVYLESQPAAVPAVPAVMPTQSSAKSGQRRRRRSARI